MQKKTLSFSQINMFLKCPRQHFYRYLQGIRTPTSGAALQSQVWHATLERNYRQKITSRRDLPLKQLLSFYAERFDEAVHIEDLVLHPDENLDRLKDQGLAIAAAHHRCIAPTVQPLFVEKRFRVSLGEDFPYDLTGVWDLITVEHVLADNKAYSKAPGQIELDRDLQLGIYSLAYRLMFGETECGLRVDAVIKDQEPKPIQLPTSRTNATCRWVLGLIEEVAQAIHDAVSFPNPTGWQCTPRFCGFWDRCMGQPSLQEVPS